MQPSFVMLCVFDFVLLSVTVYAVRGIYFAIIDEAQIDRSVTGAVSGLASCIGYLPDVFLYTMIGAWIDQGLQGYRYMFLYGIGTCVAVSYTHLWPWWCACTPAFPSSAIR